MPEESITVYVYNTEGYYSHPDRALLDPKEWSQNELVRYLKPKRSTPSNPFPIPEGKRAKWDGDQWLYEDQPPGNEVMRTNVTTPLHPVVFLAEVRAQFGAGVFINSGETPLTSTDPKTLVFTTITDTEENRAAVDALIAAHNYSNGCLCDVRCQRDRKLLESDWLFKRYRDQMEEISMGIRSRTDQTPREIKDWLYYYKQLRDFPATCTPTAPVWPTEPDSQHSCTIVDSAVSFAGHGLSNGDKVEFWATTSPTGILMEEIYYVVNALTDTFQVAGLEGGDPLTISGGVAVKYRKVLEWS